MTTTAQSQVQIQQQQYELQGPQQSVKALLYLAVISVFMRASIAVGPSLPATTTTANYLQYDNVLSTTEQFQPIGDNNNSMGVFGVVLASAAALLN
ncbi:8982_t:CDS:1, partial [Ambispora gerdemannii]